MHQVCRLRSCGSLARDRKSTRLNSSHDQISYAVFCLKKKNGRQVFLRRVHRHANVGRFSVRIHPVSQSLTEDNVSAMELSYGKPSEAVFFFNHTATTEIYTLSLHDALPVSDSSFGPLGSSLTSRAEMPPAAVLPADRKSTRLNSSHDQISYAVFCLKKKIVDRQVREVDPVVVLVPGALGGLPHLVGREGLREVVQVAGADPFRALGPDR